MLILSRVLLALLILSAIFWICIDLIAISFGANLVMSGVRVLIAGLLIYLAYDNWMVIERYVNL